MLININSNYKNGLSKPFSINNYDRYLIEMYISKCLPL